MAEVVIRNAREEELKDIQELSHQLFLHDEEYDPSLNMNWSFEKAGQDYFKKKINDKKNICLVAEVKGEVVGYLAGGMIKVYPYRTIKKQSELENMLIKEEFRGQEIGQKLFEEFVKWCKDQGAERIKVLASAENLRAIKFYERVGFVPYAAELEFEVKS